MDKEKQKRIAASMSAMNKKFGADTVMTVANAVKLGKLDKRVIATPSLELNDALHCGGLSGIVELYGPNSSGKTSLAIDTIVAEQKKDPDFYAAWLETEASITPEILADHGVDLTRLAFWQQEDVGNAESSLDIARGFISAGDIDMLVVNSIAGLSPKVETQDDLEKQNIALTARLLSKFFRVANGLASKNKITMVFINQTRDNIGVMFGDTSTTTGGKALSFYASQRIKMNRNKIMAADPIDEAEGVKISCIIHKNRFAGRNNPFMKCIYFATYKNGIDSICCLPGFLVEAGLVRQAGAWFYYEDENGQPLSIEGQLCKFKSKGHFTDTLRANEPLKSFFIGKLGSLSKAQDEEEIKAIQHEAALIENEIATIEREDEAADINEILEANAQ